MTRRLDMDLQPKRQKMELVHINDMFAYIFRCQQIFDTALTYLLPEHFDPDTEPQYGLLWATALLVYRRDGELQYKPLKREVSLLLADAIDQTLTRSQAAVLDGDDSLLHWIFHEVENDSLDSNDGMRLLREFLLERDVMVPFEQTVIDGGVRNLDFQELFGEYQRKNDRISSLGRQASSKIFPDVWEGLSITGNRVGVAAFDRFMPDGDAAGECYGIIGVTGGGKTMSMVDIAVTRAQEYRNNPVAAEKQPVVLYASYEEPTVDMRCRLLARAARVDKRRLEQAKGYHEFSRRGVGGYQEYEMEYFRAEGIPLDQAPGEYDRMQEAGTWLNEHMAVLDMTGTENEKGYGYIDELRSEVAAFLVANPNKRIGLMLIDYAGLMIERHLAYNGKDFGEMRHWLRAVGTDMKAKLAKQFNCPVWIAQQFSGEANKKGPTARLSHADAAEGKSFANGLVYCFGLGSVDPVSRAGQLHCTKDRRTGNNLKHTVIKLDGQFQRILDVSAEYRIDSATGSIVANRVAAEFGGSAPRHTSRSAQNMLGLGAMLD